MATVLPFVGQGSAPLGGISAAQQADEPSFPARIVWFTRLDQALAEAERTNRPILLHSAAPACSGAPGMW